MTTPTIDHGILSPSGRVSARSRKAALARAAARLFPPGYWDAEPETECAAARLRRQAAELRDLADRGMRPRAHRRRAAELDAAADAVRL